MLADPAFIRSAGSTLIGRAIARREARAMFDVAAGFVYAQTLMACVQLDLFAILRRGAATPADLAPALGLTEAATHRLMVAAEPLKLVERRGGERWGLGRRGAAVLGNPGLVAMIHHHDVLYRELADPVALLRRGAGAEMAAFWPYAGAERPDALESGAVAHYSRLMAASQDFVAGEVLAAVNLSRHRHLIDVGGGEGVFAAAAAARHPALRVTVFDLPAVAALAAARFAAAGLGERAGAVGGSFLHDPIPTDADVMSLVRILHDHDDAVAARILARTFDALPAGGMLVIAEPMAGAPAAPGIATYFAFYLLAMGSGRPRTADEIVAMVQGAGFGRIRVLRDRNPTATRVITAMKPEAA